MGKIKLLYATGANGGGVLKNVTDLSTHLDPENFEIFVVLSTGKQSLETQTAVSKIKRKKINIKYIHISKTISPTDIISLVKICFYLKHNRFDIVHAHSSKAGALFRLAAFFAKAPVVIYTPHCFYFTAFKGYKRYFYRLLERFLVRFTHHTVISGTEQKAVEECCIDKRNLSIIDNAIDISEYGKEYSVSEILKQFNIPEDHIVVTGVGRLVKQKNWDMFIEAARIVLSKNKEITFIIAGDGPDRNRLCKQIAGYGLGSRIKLAGYMEDISKIYTLADVFVSTSRWEGLPYTYLEALYFKIPMIITHTEGMEYFTKRANCTCVPVGDANYLADKILEKIPLLSDELSQTDTKYPFPLTDCMEQYEKLYHDLYYFSNSL
jgi:glycosyltransferase involved in cell wall biosynthesis